MSSVNNPPPHQRPNIVYILADDMGYGDLSCLNPASKIKTENLDRIAQEGMIFRDAHSTSAVCTPSRYGILTGRYNWRSRLKKGVIDAMGEPVIEAGRATVASFLKTHGYTTACIGKWHLGWHWPTTPDGAEIDYTGAIREGPTACGFDSFFGIPASLDMPPYLYVNGDRVVEPPTAFTEGRRGKEFWREGPIAPGFDHAEVSSRLEKEAVDFIDKHSENPFFLYLSLTGPHTPILPTAPFRGKSGTNAYGDFCLEIDHLAGQIAAALERNQISRNTILIFTSDNGCSPTADFSELHQHGHHPSYCFRGHKADIYEGGHRIPLVVRWPEAITGGSACDATVCLSDLFATCAEILGVPLADNEAEDSISTLPLWRGDASPSAQREAVVHHSFDGSFSIRSGEWKLEMCPGSGGWSHPRFDEACDGLPPIQLYNLKADIGETVNVSEKHPEIVNRLRQLLTHTIQSGRSTPGSHQANTGEPHWEQLWWMEPQS